MNSVDSEGGLEAGGPGKKTVCMVLFCSKEGIYLLLETLFRNCFCLLFLLNELEYGL